MKIMKRMKQAAVKFRNGTNILQEKILKHK